jgi:hypothetical protein
MGAFFLCGAHLFPDYTLPMRGPRGCLGSCLTNLLLLAIGGGACVWLLLVALNPWALHIGGRSTPLLYWHGTGTVVSKNGKAYPLYVSFWPGRPQGIHGGGRREGKIVSANLRGTGWLCVAPGSVEKMQLSGTMYGGYTSSADSLFDFRLLEWRKPFSINPPNRGFFDLAGGWQDGNLVMNRPNEQGIRFLSGLFIDHATVTLHWASYDEFDAACGRAK